MRDYLAGGDIALTIALVDDAGIALDVSAVSYRVIDGAGDEVIALTALDAFVSGDTEVALTIVAANNALVGTTPSVRTVQLYLTTTEGTALLEEHYRLVPETLLVIPSSSFQTYGAALSVAADMVNLDAWDAAARRLRVSALIQARHNIAQLSFGEVMFPDWQSRVAPRSEVGDLSEYTTVTFALLPLLFRETLARAQVLEANDLLGSGAGSIAEKRDAGVISDTVGESSQTFAAGKRVQAAVCPRAMATLSKYLNNGVRIGRA